MLRHLLLCVFALAQNVLPTHTVFAPFAARRVCRPGPPLPNASYPGKKSVLVIGDSISINLMSFTEDFLGPLANASHAPFSGDGGALDTKYAMDTADVMTGAGATHPWLRQNITARYGDGCLNATFLVSSTQQPVAYDVISFNFGVHDVDFNSYGEEWVPLELYISNVRAIKRTLQATGAKVVFQSSTPVPYNLTSNQRILDWNAAAKAVMAEAPTAAYSDLYAVIVKVCGEPPYNAPDIPDSPNCSISDYGDVHYHAEGWEILGNATGESIVTLLQEGDDFHDFHDFHDFDDFHDFQDDAARAPPPKVGAEGAIPCDGDTLLAEARARGAQEEFRGHSFDKDLWTLAGAIASNTSCPENSTCMVTAYSYTMLGCCMGYGTKAVSCGDHVHCCPEGWTCDPECHLGWCSCLPPTRGWNIFARVYDAFNTVIGRL